MAGPFLQDVVVALVAFGAATVVVRRLIGFAAAGRTPECGNCASSACAPAPPAGRPPSPSPASGTHPLMVVRPPRR